MKQDGKYRFGRIMERDIDVMLLHSFSMDTGFLPLFLKKLNSDSFPNAQLIDVELSKADPYWGESDVTVRFTSGSRKYALLIEDKVGAVAQPEQCSRYDERGKIGIENAEYDAFFVLSVPPANILISMKKQKNTPI